MICPYSQVVDILYLMNGSGLYGQLTGISATIVAAFLVFGAFLQGSGMGRLFMNLGTFLAGRYTGGPAKVVVVESGLFGMTSGSSVANVVVTGAVTIPEMKRIGLSAFHGRRHRGRRERRWPDYATDHGRGGLRDGRDDFGPVCRTSSRQRRSAPCSTISGFSSRCTFSPSGSV